MRKVEVGVVVEPAVVIKFHFSDHFQTKISTKGSVSKDDRVDARCAVNRTPEGQSPNVFHSTFDGNNSELKDAKLMTVLDMSDIKTSPREYDFRIDFVMKCYHAHG